MVALSISSVLVVLVANVFLAQNRFYAESLSRTQAEDALRAIAEVVSGDIRATQVGGVVAAAGRRVVLRAPLAIGGVCSQSGLDVRAYMPGSSTLDTDDVVGYAVQDSLGDWSYRASTWASFIQNIGASQAAVCSFNGMDTTGIASDFVHFQLTAAGLGDLVMIYRETELLISASQLDTGMLALYRGTNGGTLSELATGLMNASQFEYFVNGSYTSTPSGPDLPNIQTVRMTLQTAGSGDSTSAPGFTGDLTLRVPLAGAN